MAEIEIKHLKEILSFLKEGHERNEQAKKDAERFVYEWDAFEHAHPEVGLITSDTEWYAWLNEPEHSGLTDNANLWMGREIRDAYEHLDDLNEPHEEHGSGEHSAQLHAANASVVEQTFGLAAAVTLTALATPQYMEDDKNYKSIRKKAIQDWEKTNGKKINSLEGQEFLYGSLDGTTPSMLDALTESRYREFANEGNGKYKNRQKALKRYEKARTGVSQNPDIDPIIYRETQNSKKIIKARQKALERAGQKVSIEELTSIQNRYMWERFVETCPEKALAYKDHLPIKLVFERKRLASLASSAQAQGTPQPLSKNQARIQELKTSIAGRSAQNDIEIQKLDKSINQQATSITARKHSAGVKADYQAIREEIGSQAWDEYVSKNPKLAKFYTASHPGIRKAVERSLAKEREAARNTERVSEVQEQAQKQAQEEEKRQKSFLTRSVNRLNRILGRSQPREFDSYQLQQTTPPTTSNIPSAGQGSQGIPSAGPGIGNAAGGMAKNALLKASAPLWPWIIGILIFLLLFLIILFIVLEALKGGGDGLPAQDALHGAPSTEEEKPIPGLSLAITGPDAVANGQTIQYEIIAVYSGTDELLLYINLASVLEAREHTGSPSVEGNRLTWYLKDKTYEQTDQGKKYVFRLLVAPTLPDVTVSTTIIAKNQTEAIAPVGGKSGNSCTEPHEGTGWCSVDNLKKYFNGNSAKALEASILCQEESKSNPFAHNSNCPPDDSIGLFQINLLAHCPGAYSNPKACVMADQGKRNQCEAQYKDVEQNIQKMMQLSSSGANWGPWGAWPKVQSKLRGCGIL